MDRKEFIKKCGLVCLGLSSTGLLLQSCISSKISTGDLKGAVLHVHEDEFLIEKNGEQKYRKYIILQNPNLQFPICVFRYADNNFKAILMQCTHQGSELQVFGERLVCSAHGSEFNNLGNVTNGPAEANLRTFPVEISNNELKIPIV